MLRTALPVAFIVAVTTAAAWQPQPQQDRDRDYYQNRDRYDQNRDRYDQNRDRFYRNRERQYLAPIYDARNDLLRVQRQRRLSDRDERRVASGLHNVDRFLVNWNEGRFDKDRLDGLVEDLDSLAGSDRLPPGARQMFARDRDNIRAFRARGDYRR